MRAFPLALVAVLAAGCTHLTGTRAVGTPAKPTGAFLAGACKVDITPAPGFPLGGHSIAASIGRGVWLPLHATAFYFCDPDGHRLVLVSCDLWSMPAGLADTVAELVANDPRTSGIGRGSIVMAATHTHQSPGNFSSNIAYNTLASPEAGFDPSLFQYFAHRIAEAILSAASSAEPAQVYFSESRSLGGVMRNRSMPAFRLDPEARDIMHENSGIAPPIPTSEYPDPLAIRAVDPRLRLLWIQGRDGILGVAGFCAMHPTCLGHDTEVYSSDVFGAAECLAEQRLAKGNGRGPCVALFNGAEGDISPYWVTQDRGTLLVRAGQIADAILHDMRGGKAVAGAIRSDYDIVPIAKQPVTQAPTLREATPDVAPLAKQKAPLATPPRHMTHDVAVAGGPMVGGAEDGRTKYDWDGFREGSRNTLWRSSTQGSKQDMASTFAGFQVPAFIKDLPAQVLQVPKEVPLQVATLGPLVFATLPGEFTTVMGRRIEMNVRSKFPDTASVLLIGLANEYLSYFTTPEEYDSQQYEGASTLYGPAAGPLINRELGKLAADCRNGVGRAYPTRFDYLPGNRVSFFPPPNFECYNPDDGLGTLLMSPADGLPYRRFPNWIWNESAADIARRMATNSTVMPHEWIQEQLADGTWQDLIVDGTPEDNRGLDFVTVMTNYANGTVTWHIFWMPPRGINRCHLFRVAFDGPGTLVPCDAHIPPDCP